MTPNTRYLYYAITLSMRGMATKVPREAPRLVNTTTSKILVILFRQNPLKEEMSSEVSKLAVLIHGGFNDSLGFFFSKIVHCR